MKRGMKGGQDSFDATPFTFIQIPYSTVCAGLCHPSKAIHLCTARFCPRLTISHPDAKKWRRAAASRGVAQAVGDSRQAEKDELYTPMAQALDMEFCAIVLYTYGGFHQSALSFIRQLGLALDPATCLVSHTKWKNVTPDDRRMSTVKSTDEE